LLVSRVAGGYDYQSPVTTTEGQLVDRVAPEGGHQAVERWILHGAGHCEYEDPVARTWVGSFCGADGPLGKNRPLLVVVIRRQSKTWFYEQSAALDPVLRLCAPALDDCAQISMQGKPWG